MKVANMTSNKGNKIANQFVIDTDEGIYFHNNGKISQPIITSKLNFIGIVVNSAIPIFLPSFKDY